MGIRIARGIMPLVLLALVGSGGAFAAGTSATVFIQSGKVVGLGPVLVNGSGLTLYHMTSEGKGSIACTGACAAAWPPLLSTGTTKPVAGTSLTASRLGTIKRPDGRLQITYNGFALYRYAADKAAGTGKGEAVGGVWFAINPSSGKIVKPTASSTGNAGAASTVTPNGGEGPDYGSPYADAYPDGYH